MVMFLRGINVGGVRVPMDALRILLQEAGLIEAKTWLQTGNAMFSSGKTAANLKKDIEKRLTERFDYEAFAHVLSLDELKNIVASYPFRTPKEMHRYAILCSSAAVVNELMTAASELFDNTERIAAGDKVVYWEAPKGTTTSSPFGKLLAKARYKEITTTRNLNTLEKMISDAV